MMNESPISNRSPTTMTTDRVTAPSERTHTKENDTHRSTDEAGGPNTTTTDHDTNRIAQPDSNDADNKIKNPQDKDIDKKVFES